MVHTVSATQNAQMLHVAVICNLRKKNLRHFVTLSNVTPRDNRFNSSASHASTDLDLVLQDTLPGAANGATSGGRVACGGPGLERSGFT